AEPGVRQLPHQRLVHHRDIWLNSPDRLVEIYFPDDRSGGVMNIDLHLQSSERARRPLSGRPLPYLPLLLTARRIISKPWFGPGTDPSISSRFRSVSTRITFKFWTVTRSFPMWPAMRMPLNTRPGVALDPIEPGAR